MKLFYEVYLPVAVMIDEDGELVGTPYIDWDGTPWMDTDNVWTNDPALADDEEGVWSQDRKSEEQAEVLLSRLLVLGVDQHDLRL